MFVGGQRRKEWNGTRRRGQKPIRLVNWEISFFLGRLYTSGVFTRFVGTLLNIGRWDIPGEPDERSKTMKNKFKTIALATLAVVMTALGFAGCCMRGPGGSCCIGTQPCCCGKCKPCHSNPVTKVQPTHADPSGSGVGIGVRADMH